MSRATRATDGGSARPRLAILDGIRPYDRRWLPGDVLAGVTLAALGIPEVMGYTKISGTPVITGLYTLLLPIVVFAILGSSRHLVVAGDSATAAILAAGISGLALADVVPGSPDWLALAGLCALMCGALLLVARLLGLGFLADFISRTVLVGFLTGVGVQVALGQVGGMLGVPAPAGSLPFGSGTIASFLGTLAEVGQANGLTVVVSVAVIAILVVFGRWVKVIPGGLVAVVGAIVASFALDLAGRGLAVVGPVPGGLPAIGLPAGLSVDHALSLLPTAVSMVLVILAQSAATSRAYAVRYDEPFVENDDLVGLGVANLAAGLSGTFVVNGSPTKTEMVDDAKGRSQIAQLTTAATVAVVLLFLTKPLEYLPEAVLSAVVFVIGLKLVDLRGLREIRRLRPEEFWIAAVTAGVVVTFGVEQGIVLAIVLSVLDHVRRHYQPHNTIVTWDEAGRRIPRPGGARRGLGARADRLSLRGRAVLRERHGLRGPGTSAHRRPEPAALVRPPGRRDGRRRLHGRKDGRRRRPPAPGSRDHLRGRGRLGQGPPRARPVRARRGHRRGRLLHRAGPDARGLRGRRGSGRSGPRKLRRPSPGRIAIATAGPSPRARRGPDRAGP